MEAEKISFIPGLQKHCFRMKADIDNLKTMGGMLTGFNNTSEFEQISQMKAIREMQLEAGIRALTFR